MELLFNTLLQITAVKSKDYKTDSIDDKIFKLRKEMRDTKKTNPDKFNPKNITDSESNIYYALKTKAREKVIYVTFYKICFRNRLPQDHNG